MVHIQNVHTKTDPIRYLMAQAAQRVHHKPGGVNPEQSLPVTNRDFSRHLPSGESPVLCMLGWAASDFETIDYCTRNQLYKDSISLISAGRFGWEKLMFAAGIRLCFISGGMCL